jgi:plasmid stability protein
MPSITVKNILDSIYNKLKKKAKAQHRSMNSEIIACLEQTVERKRVSPDEILRQARMMRKKSKEAFLLKRSKMLLTKADHDCC